MHTKPLRLTFLILIVVTLLVLTTGLTLAKGKPLNLLAPQAPVGSGFTYQGQLTDGGVPAEGSYDLQFELYDAETDGNLIGTVALEDVSVTDGLFTVSLDFGTGAFDGQARWLAIGVRPGDETGAYTPLTPRQPLAAAPYSQYALEAGSISWENVSENPFPGSCAAGEILAWNASLEIWECVENTGTTYTAGFGLDLDGTTFNVLTDTVQTRVTGTCAPGSMVTAINADGSVVCETDDDTTYTAGTGLDLVGTTFNVLTDTVQTRVTGACTPGSMVTAINADGSVVCETDDDTTYAAGFGLDLDGSTFNILTGTMQTRVTGTCAPGSMVTAINADGTVVCETDDDTTYAAGFGLELDDSIFNVLTDTLQTRVTGTCAVGSTIQAINADGSVECGIVSGTPVNAGFGLELDGTTFNVLSDTIQTRVTGNCAVGSTIRMINADGTVECEPHDTQPIFTQTAIDTTDRTGAESAMAIGADGLPIIAYRYVGVDPWQNYLAVAHCNDIACTSAITTMLDTTGRMERPSITIGSDGLAIIAYYRIDGAYDLKVAHCENIVCTSATLNSPDTTGNVGADPSIAIGTDGLPIISYTDATGVNLDLKVAHCNDVACSTASTVIVDEAWGQWSSIAIGVDGLPIISYKDNDAQDLKVAHCENATCTSVISTTLATTGNVGDYTEITIGNDGLPIIVFKGGTSYSSSNLTVAHCDDITCATATITDLWSGHDYVAGSITIGSDGLPVLSFRSNDTDRLMVAHCYDVACTTSSWIIVDDSANEVGTGNSIKIGTDGMPIISYFVDGTAGDLKVTHCSNVFCVPHWRR